MRNKIFYFIVAVALSHLAVTWPWDPKEEKKAKPAPAQVNREKEDLAPVFTFSGPLGKSEKEKAQKSQRDQRWEGTQAEDEEEKRYRAAVKRAARQEKILKAQEQERSLKALATQQHLNNLKLQQSLSRPAVGASELAKKPIEPPKVQPRTQDVRIVQIQQQVQEMVAVNDSLQDSSVRQAAEIRKLGEQVKNQQTILRNPQAPALNNLTTNDTQEILRQQRIRILSQQVQQGQRVRVVEEVKRNT